MSQPTTKITITLSECEHHGDLDSYLADVRRCGATVISRSVNMDDEEGTAVVEVADVQAFRAALSQTETWGYIGSFIVDRPQAQPVARLVAAKPKKAAKVDAWAVNTPVTIIEGPHKGRHGIITEATARSVTVSCYLPSATRKIGRAKIATTLVKRQVNVGSIYSRSF